MGSENGEALAALLKGKNRRYVPIYERADSFENLLYAGNKKEGSARHKKVVSLRGGEYLSGKIFRKEAIVT